jgi:hypothetical protein
MEVLGCGNPRNFVYELTQIILYDTVARGMIKFETTVALHDSRVRTRLLSIGG